MNKIEMLIQELCPEGVVLSKIDDHIEYEQPTKYIVSSTNYSEQYRTPVLTAGQTFLLGYTDENDGIFEASPENPAIIFDDFTTAFKWVDFRFKVKSSAMKILTPKEGSDLDLKFLFHYMGVVNFAASEHARHWISVYSQFYIPTPPKRAQQEIVSILDKFTELEAELEAELDARRKQYEQYRNKLLSTHLPTDVEFKTLRELLGPIKRGKRLTKSDLAEVGSIPVFHGGLNPIGYHDKSNSPGDTVMVINTGASSGSVGWSNTPFWCSDGCFALPHSKEFSSRFIYHYASLNEKFFMDKVRKAGIPTLASESIYTLPIPVLPMARQLEIVGILDAFLELTSSHSIGVPAEIQARRKQYEYYRNKLLTFKELDAA